MADNLTVTAKDENNTTVASYTGSHSLTFGGASTIGAFNPTVSSSSGTVPNFGTATAITFTNGVATVAGANNGVMKLYKAETALVTVTDGTLNNGTGLSVTVAAAATGSFSLQAGSLTPTAGEADSLTITARDAFGNTATSYTGSHNLTFGGASSSPNATKPTVTTSAGVATSFATATATMFTTGVATVSGANNGVMKLYNAETAKVTVTEGAINNGAGLSITVSPNTAASLGLAAASVTPTAGATDNLTITAKDTYGNTAASYTGSHNVTFAGASTIGAFTPTVTSSAGTVTNLGTVTAITFTNGVATVAGATNGVMTLYKAEAAKVTVTDGTLSNGAGLTVTVGPAAAASLLLAAGSVTPTAGVADNLTITAKDAYGNTATTYTGSHNLTVGGANTIGAFNPTVSSSSGVVTSFGTSTAITFTNGVATVAGATNGVMKLYKTEAALITVTDGTLNNGGGLSITVGSAAAGSFSLAAASTVVTAGEADNLTVTALDAFGNTATSYTGSHNLTFGGASSSPNATKPTVTSAIGVATSFATATAITFTTGVATVSGANNGVMKLYNAETAKVTVTEGAINNGTGVSITVSPAVAASLALAAASVTPTAGATDSLTITAKDTYGNTITTYTGSHTLTFAGASTIGAFTPTVTSSAGTITNLGTATAITFTNGVATVAGTNNGVMTLYKAEAAKITVTDGTLSNGAGLTVTVSPAAAASLSLAAASVTPTAGVADNLTITAKDTYGNTATTYTGSHSLTFGAASTIGAFTPTVSSSSGVVTSFGTSTAITFTNGVATVAGANNGVMKLYKAETALVTVTDGTLSNGTGLSITVAAAAAGSFSLSAASTAVTAGEADNLIITALDAFGNTATSYTASHNLTFGGASSSPNATKPTVTTSAGVATSFATATAITFTNGIATTSGTSNGVMKLYNSEIAKVTVAAGAVTNGSGLAITVSAAPAASLALTAASVTPAAGTTDNLTITAIDAYSNTITSYTGSHNLTFAGASTIGAFAPTVSSSIGTVTNLGTATAITFTNGVATVAGANNGVMTLYKAEAAKITVTDGTLSNGAGLTVTVSPAAAASLLLTAASVTPSAGTTDNLITTAKDTYGNTATSYTGSHNLTFGGANAVGAVAPTVSSSAGTVTNFGTATAITFTNGVATVAGANNGVMKLYRSEAALITVTDGTLNNGAGLVVTVGSAAAGSFSLAAASTAVTAGEADSLTITARDAFGNTATSYTGSHNLTFGGASNSPSATKPTVTSTVGVATSFATATAIMFTTGVATVSGANNGVMKLYNTETAKVTVTEGAINNGTGLLITVSAGTPSRLAWTNATVSAGTLSSPCLFTCTVTTLGNSGTFTANVSVTDGSGNTVSGLEAGYSVTVSTPSSGAGSGGSFTAPTTGTSLSLSIATPGAAQSTAQVAFKAQSGVWASDTMTAQTLAGTPYANATVTLNK